MSYQDITSQMRPIYRLLHTYSIFDDWELGSVSVRANIAGVRITCTHKCTRDNLGYYHVVCHAAAIFAGIIWMYAVYARGAKKWFAKAIYKNTHTAHSDVTQYGHLPSAFCARSVQVQHVFSTFSAHACAP